MLFLAVFLLLCAQQVSAFTNGTLLPAYLCGPFGDGFPKTVGGVVAFFQLETGSPPSLLHTQQTITSFHNRLEISPLLNALNVQAQPTGIPASEGAPNTQLRAGQLYDITLLGTTYANNSLPAQNLTGFAVAPDVVVDGAIVYAETTNHSRVGRFTAFGASMVAWSACGPRSVGVVHTGLLGTDEVPPYSGLQWRAPWDLPVGTTVRFKGAAVTDNGFGPHATDFTIQAPATNRPPTPNITAVLQRDSDTLLIFFVDPTKRLPATENWKAAAFVVTITSPQNGRVLSNFTAQQTKSPISVSTNRLPRFVQVQLTAKNGNGLSDKSNQVAVTLTGGESSTDKTSFFSKVLKLCNRATLASAVRFGMDGDLDNSCAFISKL
jgi:hypothetical protein